MEDEIAKVQKYVASFIARKHIFFLDAEDVSQGVCEIMLRRHGNIDHRYVRCVIIDFLRSNHIDPRNKHDVEARRNMVMAVEYNDRLFSSFDPGFEQINTRIDLNRLMKGLNERWYSFVTDWLLGYNGVELATKYKVSISRVSQMRRVAVKGMKNELTGDIREVLYPE